MASIMGKQVPNIWSGGNINIDVSPKFLLLVYILYIYVCICYSGMCHVSTVEAGLLQPRRLRALSWPIRHPHEYS